MPHPSRCPTVFTLILGALSTLGSLSIDMGLPALPAIELAFPEAMGHGALTLSLFLVGFCLSPLFAGLISDRVGRKPVLVKGLALFAVAATTCASAQSFPGLLAARLIQGLAAGACVLLPISMVRDTAEGPAARAQLALITAILGLAPLAAPLPGGWLMTIATWRAVFGAQAIAGALLLLAALTILPETVPEARRRAPLPIRAAYGAVLSNRTFWRFCIVFSSAFAAMFAFISAAPAIFMGQYHLSGERFSWAFSVTALGVLLGTTAGGILSRVGRSAPGIIGLGLIALLAAVGLFPVITLTGKAALTSLAVNAGAVFFAFGLIGPNATHEAMRPFAREAGVAAGVSRFVQMMLAAVASGLVAALTPRLGGLGTAAILMGGFAAAAALAFLLIPSAPRPREG
ncbi:multidrug effflux MFS transporter [Nitrospirillum sp. BR 11163]|uniref:multidrug effflux MFS transporter n=1 Tax=Nitrospirillum sp. BR 11163 TaxID=3104323 RepID=UPI002AFF2400|nr:multidrug effflux MFS transporter [Nitrospirillum sp. BR 11163]MEA1672296.1 multidrug effflux MFS transporter [Nitrospirillum sp. BR 11163]